MAIISILMNCYNGEKYVKDALDSVFAQTYKDFEVVFIDNQSKDKSVEIAMSFGEKVKVIKTPRFMTLCEARVYSKPFISGEFLCVLDIDDLWVNTKLEKQIKIMNEHPEVALVYTDTIYFTDTGEEISAYGNKNMPSGRIFKKILKEYFLSLETVMIRMSKINKHNIFFSLNYDVSSDMEMFTKLSYYEDIHYIPEPLAKWRFGHVSESINKYESFPREYSQLLADLKIMIPNFEEDYTEEIKSLRGIINNMLGISSWSKNNIEDAKKYFKVATSYNKKYFIPLMFCYVTSLKNYKRIRSLGRKV